MIHARHTSVYQGIFLNKGTLITTKFLSNAIYHKETEFPEYIWGLKNFTIHRKIETGLKQNQAAQEYATCIYKKKKNPDRKLPQQKVIVVSTCPHRNNHTTINIDARDCAVN